MKLVETLCEELGLSHRQLAAFAGTDHSVISKNQRAVRQLPPDTLVLLSQLYALHSKTVVTTEPIDSTDEQQTRQWQTRLLECHHRLQYMQKKLAQMEATNSKARRLLQFAQALIGQETFKLNARQLRWAEQREFEANKLLSANNPGKMQQYQLQVKLLQLEISELETLLAV